MKSRLLLFSDLHLRPESEEICFEVLKQVEEQAHIHAVDAIAFLGDWWHLRYSLPVRLLNRVAAWVQNVCHKFPLIFLPGNHDQIDVHGENALQIFAAHGAHVFTEPTFNFWGYWLPYRKDPAAVAAALHQFSTNGHVSCPSVLFAHLPLVGAMMNNRMADTEGLTCSFSSFEKVILGHYHKRQTLGKATYIGSPWQTRADEYGQPKGFALLEQDVGTNLLSFIDLVIGPRYFRIEAETAAEAQEKVFLSGAQVTDKVTLVLPKKEELEKATQKLVKIGFQSLIGNAVDLAIPQPRFGFQKGTSLEQYAKAYVKGRPDAEDLLQLWKELNS